jgi:hypothetical protein
MRIFWVQKKHEAGDQSFESYILQSKKTQPHVLTSCRSIYLAAEKSKTSTEPLPTVDLADHDSNMLDELSRPKKRILAAVVFGIAGFAAQFEGLRLINWSCSIAQLVALALATILRAVIRRGMSVVPNDFKALDGYELDHLALSVVGSGDGHNSFSNDENLERP